MYKLLTIPFVFFGLLPTIHPAMGQSLSEDSIAGFRYGQEHSPTGKEWESPEDLSLNKEQPHAYFFSFANSEQARKVLPEHSPYWRSLNGTWKFNWVKSPEERPKDFYEEGYDLSKWDEVPVPMSWNIHGIQKDGSLKYGVPIYVNQQVIFQHQVKVDDWRGGVMRTPAKNWTTYIYRNEVGSYRRNFSVPKDWKNQDIYINFDGVDSFFYLWINGHYVGFSKNSRNLASFNISKYLNKKGENSVSVEVYRNSDASYIEAQDMFRLPGIFRTVSITAKPKVQLQDLQAIPDLDANYENGTLKIKTTLQNNSERKAGKYTVHYALYAHELYKDANVLVAGSQSNSTEIQANAKATTWSNTTLKIAKPNLWSAEKPYRYTLVAELKDAKKKTVETISTIIGFRKVEIKDTEAAADEFGLKGRYFYVNGKTVKLKGVNRHESNPEKGKVVSREQMEAEIILMKRANINHVRNAHYPDDPYWFFLCDKYGIYLENEANIESHQYYYGEASLSHPKEWRDAHVARNIELVKSTINHPSIVIWSLGNEAGPGQNFVESYKAIKNIDLSRPVQYERNNSIVDMGSNQYPSIEWVREAVKGKYKLKYPFHISEYAHAMGNASGNLIDYWEAIESTNFFMGGALWDWIDQAMYYYDKQSGEKFFAYGGDFGDKPNDGTFVNNGLIFADMKPKPQYYEVKKVYQNVGVKAVDIRNGKIEIFNKNYFQSLADYTVQWSIYADGVELLAPQQVPGTTTALAPRTKQIYNLPLPKLDPQTEYFVKVQFLLKEKQLWADKGYVQMEEQLLLQAAAPKPSLAANQPKTLLKLSNTAESQTIQGADFVVTFNSKTGTIERLTYGKKEAFKPGEGPKLEAFRAPLDNDNWAYQQWFQKGLHNLKHKALSQTVYTRKDGAIVLSFVVESQAPNAASIEGGTSGTYKIMEHLDRPFGAADFKFTSSQVWTIFPDGSIELQSSISSNDAAFNLARLGYGMQLPSDYSQYNYYGRGPINNYADRKTAQNIELHRSTVQDQFVPWPRPQSMSNNEEVRWTALTDEQGDGLLFVAKTPMATSALPWSELELTLAPHPYQLPKSKGTHLHLDAAVTGLGGNSCGQGPPLEQDRVKASTTSFGFIIRPVTKRNDQAQAQVRPAGDLPLAITRTRNGEVSIISEDTEANLYYRIDAGKTQPYTLPFPLRTGGQVAAWDKNNDKVQLNVNFPKIESIPLTVVFASSQETGEGDANHLVDGDPNSIWHTMYSVTVAQYPHWVDFDAGELKTIKGFTYTPRLDGANGHIKAYSLQLSTDGKNWSAAVAEGAFEKGTKPQIVKLAKPQQARYIRFTALSAQNGQDFASGAEFSVAAE